MIHSIQSDALEVSIQQKGIELSSIKNKHTGTEYMWQADPKFWTGQAPVLFPIIGSLKDQLTMINGTEYHIPKHGIVRHSTKPTITNHTTESITFRLHWDDETLSVYPFRFVLDVTFKLEGNQLDVSHTIRNLDVKVMPYNLGAHPAFNCPLRNDEQYSDYSIKFEHVEDVHSWLIDNAGLLTDSSIPMLENSRELKLHEHMFDDDALIFTSLKSNNVTLKSEALGEILRVDFHDFPYLGIWAKPGAPFVCIEPWHGITDHQHTDGQFLSKEKLRMLKPGTEESLSYQITILE
jgi:galactose mutarotase-like enzyme